MDLQAEISFTGSWQQLGQRATSQIENGAFATVVSALGGRDFLQFPTGQIFSLWNSSNKPTNQKHLRFFDNWTICYYFHFASGDCYSYIQLLEFTEVSLYGFLPVETGDIFLRSWIILFNRKRFCSEFYFANIRDLHYTKTEIIFT